MASMPSNDDGVSRSARDDHDGPARPALSDPSNSPDMAQEGHILEPGHPAWCDLTRCEAHLWVADESLRDGPHLGAQVSWDVPGDDSRVTVSPYAWDDPHDGLLLGAGQHRVRLEVYSTSHRELTGWRTNLTAEDALRLMRDLVLAVAASGEMSPVELSEYVDALIEVLPAGQPAAVAGR